MEKDTIVYYSIVNKKNIIIDDTSGRLETKQARIILTKMLGYFNINLPEIYTSTKGKPFFRDSNLFFNYSHSKNYIACAISKYEVGIDIEEISRNISDNIAKKYLDNEKDNSKRIETWVKKESYSKLKGLGLQIKFQNIKLNEITERNLFINSEEYMCSIYCDSDDIEFKELCLNGSELLWKKY